MSEYVPKERVGISGFYTGGLISDREGEPFLGSYMAGTTVLEALNGENRLE